MPELVAHDRSFSREEVKAKLLRLAHGLRTLAHRQETFAILADLSTDSLLAIMTTILAGYNIALCPAAEPNSTIRQWLKSLSIQRLLITNEKRKHEDFGVEQFNFNDIYSTTSALNSDLNFSSTFSSIVRTSGTSGLPKNALIAANSHSASALSVNQYFSINRSSTFALTLPLHHVSGLSILFRTILADASIRLAPSHDDMIDGLQKKQITHLSLVPTQLRRLLDDKVPLHALQALIIGGDALSTSLRDRALSLNIPLYETYGLTETASMIWVKNSRTKKTTILPHAVMTRGIDGQILVGGQSLFKGYLDSSNNLLRPFHNDLFTTGDLSDDLHASDAPLVSGRMSNRIISGGENIQAEEIERVLDTHPAISDSVVVSVSDDKFGRRPAAIIKWRNHALSESDLKNYLLCHLAPYKLPKFFLPWPDELPVGLKKPRLLVGQYCHSRCTKIE